MPDWSIIVSTYESPFALTRCLAALARMRGPFETIIADDGSGESTRAAIAELAPELGSHGHVKHVWHEKRGFRRCRIGNHALAGATGTRILFLDGDCLVRADLLERHSALCVDGSYVAGGALRLSARASERLTLDAVRQGLHERASWHWRNILSGDVESKWHYSVVPRALWPLFRRRSGGFLGGCSSANRAALVAVNGWDERFGYGFEDTDLGHRLQNAGVRPCSARLDGLVVHLFHERSYRDPKVVAENFTLARANFGGPQTRAVLGLDALAHGDQPRWETLA